MYAQFFYLQDKFTRVASKMRRLVNISRLLNWQQHVLPARLILFHFRWQTSLVNIPNTAQRVISYTWW